jgi:RNA polymerase sigma factor (sigma-70 family)
LPIGFSGRQMNNSDNSGTELWGDAQALWYSFQSGDRRAFAYVYQSNIHHLIRYGYKITGDKQVIQDCIQDLFMELWDRRERLAEVRSLKYYLFKSLRYKIIRHLRDDNTERLENQDYCFESDHFEYRVIREESGTQESQRLQAAIAKLPRRQKEAIHLRYFEEMSNEEVADLMGVNYQSACKFIYTALRNLREIMSMLGITSALLSRFF